MKRRALTIATNLPLIIGVSFTIRAAFAISQVRHMPANLVGLVPFLNEAGNIAFSLVAGDRADGVVDAGVSVDRVSDLPDFWNSHATCALRRGLAEYYFFLRHVCPDLFYGQEAGGQRGGQRSGRAVGYFS